MAAQQSAASRFRELEHEAERMVNRIGDKLRVRTMPACCDWGNVGDMAAIVDSLRRVEQEIAAHRAW